VCGAVVVQNTQDVPNFHFYPTKPFSRLVPPPLVPPWPLLPRSSSLVVVIVVVVPTITGRLDLERFGSSRASAVTVVVVVAPPGDYLFLLLFQQVD
jgi:hypothetical protein